MSARQIIIILTVLAVIVANALANIVPYNGQTTGQISDQFRVYFVPAGYVFSIWGLIYIGLLAFAIYQALPAQRDNARLDEITPLFVASSAANVIWLFLWHYNLFLLTVLFMLALLVSLIFIYLRLRADGPVPAGERWAVHLPFSIYLGWISVATIANISDVLWWLGWNGQPLAPEWWAVIMIVVAGLLAGVMSLRRRDLAFALVVVWALIGIAVRQAGVSTVVTAAEAVAALVLVVVLYSLIRRPGLPSAAG